MSNIKSEIEEAFSYSLRELINSMGKKGIFLIMLSIVSALFRIFIPNIDTDLAFLTISFKSPLHPSSILTIVSIGSAFLFFLFYLLVNLFTYVWIFIKLIYQNVIALAVNASIFSDNENIARFVNNLRIILKSNIYLNDKWLAESKAEEKRLIIPSEGRVFLNAKFEIHILSVQDNHWRAGVILVNNQNIEYIFHLYEESSQDKMLRYRIVEREPSREVPGDRKGVLGELSDKKIKMELKNVDDKVTMIVNDREISSFSVPISNIENFIIAAWADGRPYKIEFKDIKILSKGA